MSIDNYIENDEREQSIGEVAENNENTEDSMPDFPEDEKVEITADEEYPDGFEESSDDDDSDELEAEAENEPEPSQAESETEPSVSESETEPSASESETEPSASESETEPSDATDDVSADRITDLVEGLQGAFVDNSDNDAQGMSSDDLMKLADELSDGRTDDDVDQAEIETNDSAVAELNELAEEIRIQNSEADLYEQEDDDVKVFVKTPSAPAVEDTDADSFGNTSVFEIKTAPDYVDINAVPQNGELEHTNVFEPVRPQPTYGETNGSYDRYASYTDDYDTPVKHRKKYGFFKGIALIAVLLGVIFGLAWLLSKVALSVMGEDDSVSAESYDYYTSSVIINPFDDDEPGTVSMLVPEFTTDKLTIGDSGDMVFAVQKTLSSLGYLPAEKVTGKYDDDTKNAVKQFQKANYLDVTGEVNKDTYDLIFDTNATAPTTKTTDLPTTTEAETSETEVPTLPTEQETTASASAEETKPTEAIPPQQESSDEPESAEKAEGTDGSSQSEDAENPDSSMTDGNADNSEKPEGISGKASK